MTIFINILYNLIMRNLLSLLLDIEMEFDFFDEFGFMIIPFIFAGLIFVTVFIIVIIAIVQSVKRHNGITKGVGGMINKSIDLANQKLEEKIESNKPEFCTYCGSLIPKDKSECQSCGAKRQSK